MPIVVHLQIIERSLQPTTGPDVDVISGLKASCTLCRSSVFAIKVDMILSKAYKTDSCNFFRNVQVRIRCGGKVPASDLLTESIHVTGVYFIIRHFIM